MKHIETIQSTTCCAFVAILLSSVIRLTAAEIHLAWDLPTKNADGTPLTDLAGCVVYYGFSHRSYAFSTNLVGAATNCVIGNLREGMIYYFAGTAYNSIGNESDFSEELVWTSRVAGAVGVTTNPPRDKYRQPAGGHGFLAENAYFSTFRILGMSGTPRIYLDPLEVFGPGQPGICTLDRCSNLPRGEWTPVFALTNSTDRLLTYTETVTNRMLFYRLRVGY